MSMEEALVLITVEPASEQQVLDSLKKIKGIVEAHFLYGPYDIYVKIEAADSQQLNHLVIERIRNIPGIKSTMTCFIAD
jgi:DNA-binding Lrp family transcriptional regulator